MMADDRHNAAIYAIVRRHRDELALTLMRIFCFDCGWISTPYVDTGFPRDKDPDSAWSRLLGDIAQGKYYAVVMAWQAQGMAEYCQCYNTHLAEIDPFAMSGNFSMGRSVRLC